MSSDDCRKAERFGAIQRLQGAYQDRQLEPFKEVWLDLEPNFDGAF